MTLVPGLDLKRSGDVTPLLNLPMWLLAFAIALACALESLVLAATAVARPEGQT